MAQAARPWSPKSPNPCAAFRRTSPLRARRPNATPWPARPKDAPCPTSPGDRGHSGQLKKAPDNVIHKPSGGTYSKPEARVKLIPAEDITCVRQGKIFGRTVGPDNLEKRHRRRSVTPPPRVYLARSTPLTHKATMPLSHKAVTPFSHISTTPLSYKSTAPLSQKAMTPPTHKPTSPPAHKPMSPLAHKPMSPPAHKPMSPPPPVASCLSAKRSETAVNRKIVSIRAPSPVFRTVQRGAIPPAVFRKESDMNLISTSSVHVLPAHSSKVPLGTEAEPSSKSISTLENTKLCSTNNQATLKCQRTKIDADPVVEKEHTVKPSLLSPTSVLSISSSEVSPDTASRPLSRLSMFDGKCKPASLQPETNIPQVKSQLSTTEAPCVEPSKDLEVVPSTKRHTRNERETNQEATISCNMNSGAPPVLHTNLYKKPDQSKSTAEAPRVELSNDFEAVPSTKSHIRNEQQTNQEASVSCNMSLGAQAILHTELYKKPYQPESCVELSNDLDAVPSTKRHMRNERQTIQEASISRNVPAGARLILHTEPRKKTDRPDACWKGKFEVTGELTHTCDELEAHFPLDEIFVKVYEASKQMSEVLKLEALPLSHLLPKKFKMQPPNVLHDIGLCFISTHQRPNENFDHLLENVSSHIGLRTVIGTMELLIFSSRLLTEDHQTKDGKLFFCGVFRKPLRKKQHQANNHTDNVDIKNSRLSKGDFHVSEDIGMNSDMTEGKHIGNRCEIGMKLDETGVNKPKEIGEILDMTTDKQTEKAKCKKSGIKLGLTIEEETNRINKYLPMLKTPDANAVSNAAPAVSFFTGSCSPDSAGSACKSATRAPACGDPVLDSPSVFSVDIPPGETAESQIASSSSLVLDTPGFALDVPPGFTSAHRGLHILDVPPGFTSAQRGLHTNDAITTPGSEKSGNVIFSEKKTPIKFSLNIAKPVQTDVSPGFAKLLQVKKESGLPASSMPTEKITPIENMDVEVDDGSEERKFPKFRRLSDIMGASSSNNASTSSRPRNCSEVCGSAAPVPSASKFQETGPLSRKRGQPEPSEPSAAEAAKRPKVNGRMALKGSVDRRALNSNQAQGNGGKS
ncbi:unnamed protein product [Alopecurus aequalis]